PSQPATVARTRARAGSLSRAPPLPAAASRAAKAAPIGVSPAQAGGASEGNSARSGRLSPGPGRRRALRPGGIPARRRTGGGAADERRGAEPAGQQLLVQQRRGHAGDEVGHQRGAEVLGGQLARERRVVRRRRDGRGGGLGPGGEGGEPGVGGGLAAPDGFGEP